MGGNKSAEEYLGMNDKELLNELNTSRNPSEGPVAHAAIMLRSAASNKKLSTAMFLATLAMTIATVVIAIGTYEMAYKEGELIKKNDSVSPIRSQDVSHEGIDSSTGNIKNVVTEKPNAVHDESLNDLDQLVQVLNDRPEVNKWSVVLEHRLSRFDGWFDYSKLPLLGILIVLLAFVARLIYKFVRGEKSVNQISPINTGSEAENKTLQIIDHSHPENDSVFRNLFVLFEVAGVLAILISTLDLLYSLPVAILGYTGDQLSKEILYWTCYVFVFIQLIICVHVLGFNFKGLLYFLTKNKGYGKFIDYLYYPSMAIFIAYSGLKYFSGDDTFSEPQVAFVTMLLMLKVLKASIDLFNPYRVCEKCPLFRSFFYFMSERYNLLIAFVLLIGIAAPGLLAKLVLTTN